MGEYPTGGNIEEMREFSQKITCVETTRLAGSLFEPWLVITYENYAV